MSKMIKNLKRSFNRLLTISILVLGWILGAQGALATTAVVRVDINNGSASPAGQGDNWGTGHAYLYLRGC